MNAAVVDVLTRLRIEHERAARYRVVVSPRFGGPRGQRGHVLAVGWRLAEARAKTELFSLQIPPEDFGRMGRETAHLELMQADEARKA